MRLIDADALAMHMADWQLSACSEQYDTIEEAIDAVTSAPTIDAVSATIEGALGYLHKVGWIQEHDRIMTEDTAPVRHGHWQITDAYPHNVYCSECHTKYAQTHWAVWDDGSLPRRFCPNCGARMDGEIDE